MRTVWTVPENDADLKVLKGLGLKAVNASIKPHAAKISQLFPEVGYFLKEYTGPVVADLCDDKELNLFGFADVLVLDMHQVEIILNRKLETYQSVQDAAKELLIRGTKGVFIKGSGLQKSSWSYDYWSNGITSFWLTQRHWADENCSEARSIFSTATTAFLALGYSTEDSIVLAKMYLHQAMRLKQTGLYCGGFPEDERDLPYLSSKPMYQVPQPFKRSPYLGLYPIVDSPDWVELLLDLGVKTIQLRVKQKTNRLEEDIRRSITLAKKYQATLFINDYWELALELGAEAVHLGQSDLDNADIDRIRQKGLLLGVSTYCYHEVARAHALCPSYVAIGPIYPTNSKEMIVAEQGIEGLKRWKRTLNYPLVAIGGITRERMPEVLAAGAHGVALISAITEAADPQRATQQLLIYLQDNSLYDVSQLINNRFKEIL